MINKWRIGEKGEGDITTWCVLTNKEKSFTEIFSNHNVIVQVVDFQFVVAEELNHLPVLVGDPLEFQNEYLTKNR